MRRITLPGDNWAHLREPATGELVDQLTVKGRRGISVVSGRLSEGARTVLIAVQAMDDGPEKVAAAAGLLEVLSEADMDVFFRMQEATIVALLIDWSLGRPIPTIATIGDEPVSLYDALTEAVAQEAASALDLTLDTSVGDGTPDPKDPTGDSKP